MTNALTGLAMGIIVMALIVTIGIVTIQKFGDTQASCQTSYTFNTTQQKCVNATNEDAKDPTNTAWVTSNYLNTQLGSSGLSGYVPVIIALFIGVLFIGYFVGKKNAGW